MRSSKAALLNQAMQALRDSGWRLEWIGHAFGVHKSTVCRRIQKTDAHRSEQEDGGRLVSVVDGRDVRVTLARSTSYLDLAKEYAADDPSRWQPLAMFSLIAHGWSVADIAAVMECDERTVKRKVSRLVSAFHRLYGSGP